MNFWTLLENAAWVLSALVASWLLYDAYRVGRDYDEDFLVHTVEDLGEDAEWQHATAESHDTERHPS
ncbi:hypothetical protein MAUB1S_03598 [Mycolicibacterium aubagnense]